MITKKITEIQYLEGEDDCYDLHVPKNNNFFLSNRILVHNCTLWQSATDIPVRILQQSRYIFIPNTADVRTIQTLLVNTSMTKNVQTSVRDAMYLKKRLRQIKFSWVVIDKMEQTMDVFVPFAPLSNHAETEN